MIPLRSSLAAVAAFSLSPLGGAAADPQELNRPPKGFTALFNGRDLEGWFGRGTEDPRKLWAMSPDDLAVHQEKTLEDVKRHWSVENGELVNDGRGLYLTTRKDYGDFELLLEYKTVPEADSGIYLRGVPQVQIWDPGNEREWENGSDKGSGGLWNNPKGSPGKFPLKMVDKPFGQWNEFRILMIGERVTVDFNGQRVVDDAVMHNYFGKREGLPMFARGPIQLQTHGGEIRWRNIFLREIGAEEANKHLSNRFVSLFDGQTLNGWQGAVSSYEVVEGNLRCKPGKGGTLLTEEEYEDFIFRFEFRLPPGGNNGVAIRAPREGDPAWKAFEIQILDDGHEKYAKLKDYQYHGSIYGLVPAKRGYLRPTGEWNFQEIEARGSQIRVSLNGTVIVDADVSQIDRSQVGRLPQGVDRARGYVGFAGHSDPVEFRNIFIKRLY